MLVLVSLKEIPVFTFLLLVLKEMLEVLSIFIVVGDSVVVDMITKEYEDVKMTTNFLKNNFLSKKLTVRMLRMRQLANLTHKQNIPFSTGPYLLPVS